jgi:hypothetical protein
LSTQTGQPSGDSSKTSQENGGEAANQAKKTRHSHKKDMWTIMDESFQRTLNEARIAYRTNYLLNIVIVAIGVILLATSLVFAWTRGLNPDTITFAGLGIADFTAIFLVSPQFRIQQLLGDWEQMQVIYRTWYDQSSLIDTYNIEPTTGIYKVFTLAEVTAVNDELNKIGQQAISSIEKYVGAEQTKDTTASSKDGGTTQPTGKPTPTKPGEATSTS